MKLQHKIIFLFLLIFCGFFSYPCVSLASDSQSCANNSTFNIGAGIYDITGPAAEEGMMGYGMLYQQTAGIYQRLWARAFVIESPCNQKRVVFVNVDLGQVFQAVKQHVIKKLQAKYGNLYDEKNVLITATHEHSGPGGYSTYTFYDLTTFGFDRKHLDTIVDGIVQAIEIAQHNITPSTISFARGELAGINFNRSPTAYLENPAIERARFSNDVDTEMTLIRFDTKNKKPLGLINWFPIHGVSMNNKNRLINGDNKGYAEYLFEKDFASRKSPDDFVAAFAQANAGDVSPNLLGHEGGSGLEGILAVEKAGRAQYLKAKTLFSHAKEIIKGDVDYRHIHVKMDEVAILPRFTDGKPHITCPAAIGVSMLAGTQDGEGLGKQGATCDDISRTLPDVVCEMVTTECQGAKPIALQTGLMKPYPWTPNILPLQIIKIGNLVIVAAPFEWTTMTGRRIREAVAKLFPANHHVVLSTLANAYAGYVATNEEYQIQRYEGASTHFGPWTQNALQQEYVKLAEALVQNKPVDSGPTPLDLVDEAVNLQPGVVFDDKPLGKEFGAVYKDAQKTYHAGDVVSVMFWGAHPKNNYRIADSFLKVQQLKDNAWMTVLQDRDWETEYHWQRHFLSYSLITIVWRTDKNTPPGLYRIIHSGDWKSGWNGKIFPYEGVSTTFEIVD